jgi:apolipoprotein N-acyltransferase
VALLLPRRGDRRILRRELLAVLSGVLLALSFPKFGHGVVGWFALVPLLVALAEAHGARAFALGYLAGAVASLGIVYWTALVVIQYGGLSLPVGIGVMVLLCFALALFPSLFAWAVGRWTAVFGPRALLMAPVAWVATEILRAHTLFNFSWCLLGYSQHANLPVLQLARYFAVYGVSFVVAATSSVLAYAVVERDPGPRRKALLAMAVVLAVVWAHGAWLLSRPVAETGRVRVGLVQASILQGDKWDPDKAVDNVQAHLDLTRRAAAQGARLVAWPESAVPFLFDHTPALANQLRAFVSTNRIYLLFGNDDREDRPAGDYKIWVGAKMLDPNGGLVLRYHKIRLVPFGEYVPIQSVLTLGGRVTAKLVHQVADFTPGTEYAVAPVDGHPIAAFICYEAIFPDLVRPFAAGGAELLVNITNDGWYGRTSAPYQHLAMAVFRAVETGRYLARAANTGITAVVDPRGRVLEQTQLFERTVLVRDVPAVTGTTFYVRHGDVLAWACLAAAAALTLLTSRRILVRKRI